MLNFKDYLEKEIKEESVSGAAKFIGGFGGNLVGQGLKGSSNVLKGVGRVAKGIAAIPVNTTTAAGYGLLGNKEKTIEKIKDIGTNIGSDLVGGLKNVVKGAVQIGGAATLVTPTLRGLQASNEKGLSRLNRNRNSVQRFFGLNSNKDEPLIISDVPRDSKKIIKMIEDMYEDTAAGKSVSLRIKPEYFLKNFINAYNKIPEDRVLDNKFKYLLKTYFPNYEVVEIQPGYFLNTLNSKVFYEDSDINQYIDYLYSKSLVENIVLITGNDMLFFDELVQIHNNYFSSNNLITKSKDSLSILKEQKNKIIQIIKRFLPNKKLKLNKKTSG
jgi:hypothetical protein